MAAVPNFNSLPREEPARVSLGILGLLSWIYFSLLWWKEYPVSPLVGHNERVDEQVLHDWSTNIPISLSFAISSTSSITYERSSGISTSFNGSHLWVQMAGQPNRETIRSIPTSIETNMLNLEPLISDPSLAWPNFIFLPSLRFIPTDTLYVSVSIN